MLLYNEKGFMGTRLIAIFLVFLLAMSVSSCSDSTAADRSPGEVGDQNLGSIFFPPDEAIPALTPDDPRVYQCTSAAYVDTGSLTSPGIFGGGCPGPMPLMGTWGPATLYSWTDFLTLGDQADSLASVYNLFGLPNGIAMIDWEENNLSEALDDSFSVEMITGWGSYPSRNVPNDYGWINGTILNLLDQYQAPFIHIYYREVTSTDADGVEHGILHFWELLLDETTFSQSEVLYEQLRDHIETYWDATVGTTYPDYTGDAVPEPLASNISGVYYMQLPDNQEIPSVASEYWSANTAYPENNFSQ